MIRLLSTLLMVFALTSCQAQGIKGALDKLKAKVTESDLTKEEAGKGLKEALKVGAEEAVAFLSKENGYYESVYKVLLPEEAQKVVSKLKMVPGFSNVEQELVLRINRAAELAASKATPIFVNAITQLTFQDALNILMGEQNAATNYLRSTTSGQLYAEFKPVIAASLDEVNARQYWKDAVTAYNKIPLVTKINTELDDHVANKALGGLFQLVEVKEAQIRTDVSARTSDILKKVFAKQDKR
ncbi:MAG: hypothetical protein KIPDCIKN_02883 [Haliscomenobacter sp.]|jgi:hypothetical protein|nr:hypothetical protein [Haliscomenobacter sp.]